MHYKQNNKESKTYVQGLRPFGSVLPHGVKGILKKNGYNYSEIINKWNFLVGKNIANYFRIIITIFFQYTLDASWQSITKRP